MNNFPVFYKSLFDSAAGKFNPPAWDLCWKAYDGRQYLKSIELLFDYINPELNKKFRSPDKKTYKIPHGSLIVNINIGNEKIFINAPFLNLPDKNQVPLLRQVNEVNFNELYLAQIRLKNNSLAFEYSCKLHECNPDKLYAVFKKICLTGDKYDDKFISQFNASRIKKPRIKPLNPERLEVCYRTIKGITEEALEYVKYFEKNRYFNLAWNMLAGTMRKIDYYARPQGQFRNELEQAIADMHSDRQNVSEIVTRAKDYLYKILNADKRIIVSDLYDIEVFISYKNKSSLKDIQGSLQKPYERVQSLMESESYMDAAMEMLFCFYNLYYHNDVNDKINKTVVSALRRSSGKEWKKGAPVLYRAMGRIMNAKTVSQKRFFNGLFGKKYG